ncbi:hypothetical protein GQ55_6G189300 [Panicum hallii var. hallii]|uniref:Uncharacterized protein n=1 Tax=Panicum hallii var. hallii TaxID=1504633 RepID=A0A2T7D7A3_9POAL|nr:hypothetical protein GQ55_6G189300 [Panicum hallii var. hallii]
MGNCQAAEVAAVVIQHPGGKVERLHGPATAGEVMRSNPGHYVALVVLRVSGVGAKTESGCGGGGARITKVKLLKPKDALLLGQVYRLVTSQEVAKAIQARRQDKTRRCGEAPDDRRRQRPSPQPGHAAADQEQKREEKADRQHRGGGPGGGGARGRHWRPSLQSISESAS